MSAKHDRGLYLRLLSYVRPYAKAFGAAVLAMVAAAATEPLFPALIKPLLDQGFGAGAKSLPPSLFAAAIVAISTSGLGLASIGVPWCSATQ